MSSPAYDLGYLRAGIAELENYLLSKELYWVLGARPPAGEPDYPRLTLGGLLLAQARARAWELAGQQSVELVQMEEQIDRLQARWRVAWERKAAHAFHARLILWQNYLEDYRQEPYSNADRYAYEVRRRVMLHLLYPTAGEVPQVEVSLLKGLDKRLRAVWVPGDFVWEVQLQNGFPEAVYWYLYGFVRSN
jgi:hypothetical protein